MADIYGKIKPGEMSVSLDPETGSFSVSNGAWGGRLIDFKRGHEGPYVLEITDRSAPNRGEKYGGNTFIEKVK